MKFWGITLCWLSHPSWLPGSWHFSRTVNSTWWKMSLSVWPAGFYELPLSVTRVTVVQINVVKSWMKCSKYTICSSVFFMPLFTLAHFYLKQNFKKIIYLFCCCWFANLGSSLFWICKWFLPASKRLFFLIIILFFFNLWTLAVDLILKYRHYLLWDFLTWNS